MIWMIKDLTKVPPFQHYLKKANQTYNKLHQISLSQDDSGTYLYVTHSNGISKYNAITGAKIKSVDLTDGAYNLLVDGSNITI